MEIDCSLMDEILKSMETVRSMIEISDRVHGSYTISEQEKVIKRLKHVEKGLDRALRDFSKKGNFEVHIDVYQKIYQKFFPETILLFNPPVSNEFIRCLTNIHNKLRPLLTPYIIPHLLSYFDEEAIVLMCFREYPSYLWNREEINHLSKIEELSSFEKADFFKKRIELELWLRDLWIDIADRNGVIEKIKVQISSIKLLHEEFKTQVSLSTPVIQKDPNKIITLEDLSILDGYAFEHYLQKLFEKMGFKLIKTQKSRGQGCDLIIYKDGLKIVIQIKNFKANVGNSAIQEIATAVNLYEATRGMVVVTTDYTKDARRLADRNNISLINGKELSKIMDFFPIHHQEIMSK